MLVHLDVRDRVRSGQVTSDQMNGMELKLYGVAESTFYVARLDCQFQLESMCDVRVDLLFDS